MTDIFSGKVTLMVGASAGSKVTITNLKDIRYRKVNPITPQTVMNTVSPVGWHKGHKHVIGEVHVLSEAVDAFRKQGVDYLPDAAENPAVPYFVATITDEDGQTWTSTGTGVVLSDALESYRDGEDTVYVYHFKAYKMVKAGPS